MQPASCLASALASGADAAVGAVSTTFAETIRDGAEWVIKTTVGWWIDVPAIDLEASPAVRIRGYVMWLAVVVAAGGVIWQGIVMAVSRRPEPAFTVARGLFTLVLWTTVGVAGPAAALRAGDVFSSWVLDQAASGHATERLIALAGLTNVTSPGAVMLLGLVMMLAGLVQAMLMMFREAAVVILAGVVVLAAAGSMTGATRPWLPRVLGWLLALICYKPAAALVYASALALVGDSADIRSFFVGVTMILLAIIALPALMKLFTWTSGSVGGGGGGLAALASASSAALHASATLSYHRSQSTQDHATRLRNDLGPDRGNPPPQPPSGPPPSGGPSSSPSTGAAAASPWLLAAATLTEAARKAKNTAQGTTDSMTRQDQP